MDRGALWAIVHGGHRESDTTERLTHTHTHNVIDKGSVEGSSSPSDEDDG